MRKKRKKLYLVKAKKGSRTIHNFRRKSYKGKRLQKGKKTINIKYEIIITMMMIRKERNNKQ